MKISLNWLNEILDSKLEAKTLEEILTSRGIEVENIEDKSFNNIVVGQIIKKEKHPDADKLSLLTVDVLTEKLQIVCGASNMKEQDKVLVALVGAKLPNGLEIKKSKIRGVESFGMCCSTSELGLSNESSGIMILESGVKTGDSANKVLNADVILDLAISPNRGDLLSHFGVAREIASFLNKKIDFSYKKKSEYNFLKNHLKVKIDSDLCPRYIGRVFKNIKIKKSPEWLVNKLSSIGLRSINNIVDITNYIMHEMGQPLHAFDLSKIEGGINVRTSKEEELELLDGSVSKLKSNDLVIADDKKVLAVAGIMGGNHSSINESTKDIFLECAIFNPSSVRLTARRLNLSTDSSFRFERGVDYSLMTDVVERATDLIVELADCDEVSELIDIIKIKNKEVKIDFDKADLSSFLGFSIEDEKIISLLRSLGFVYEKGSFIVPSYRNDVRIKEDIYEEIARLYGFDNIPINIPLFKLDTNFNDKYDNLGSDLRTLLKNLGYLETINYSFVPKEFNEILGESESISLINPISENMKYMRTSLIPSLLENIRYNFNRRNLNIKIFEIGKIYFSKGEFKKPRYDETVAREENHICGVLTGNVLDNLDWSGKEEKLSFYHLKGEVNLLLKSLKIPNWDFIDSKTKYLHPGFSSDIKCCGKICGFLGKVHPNIAKHFDLEDVYIFDLNLDLIKDFYNSNTYFKEIPKFPSVRRDVSFLISEKISNREIIDFIKKLKISDIYDFNVFDLYRGEGIEKGLKSMTYYFIFSNNEKTLTDKEVDQNMDNIIKNLKREFLVEIR
jgi:phenylalanyl-tRNA synthetase beta chain